MNTYDGVVDGRRVLPEGWVKFLTTPTLGTAYGAGWWTDRGGSSAAPGQVKAGLPVDAFFAFGNFGQRIAVIPSERLVIVRMARSHLPHGGTNAFEALVIEVISSLRQVR